MQSKTDVLSSQMIVTNMKTTAYRRISATARRRELIQAGIACLGRGGLAAFTIDQICTEAGVSRGLINHHFKSKEDLMVCIYADMTAYLIRAPGGDDKHLTLHEIIEANFDENNFNPLQLRAWLAIWSEVAANGALRLLHRKRYKSYQKTVVAALAAHQHSERTTGDNESVARALIALIDGLWLRCCLHSASFSLTAAKADCYQFLQNHGFTFNDHCD